MIAAAPNANWKTIWEVKVKFSRNLLGNSIFTGTTIISPGSIFNEDFLPSSKKEYIKNDINNYQKNVIDQIFKRFQKKRYKLCSADNAVETLRIMNKLMKKWL